MLIDSSSASPITYLDVIIDGTSAPLVDTERGSLTFPVIVDIEQRSMIKLLEILYTPYENDAGIMPYFAETPGAIINASHYVISPRMGSPMVIYLDGIETTQSYGSQTIVTSDPILASVPTPLPTTFFETPLLLTTIRNNREQILDFLTNGNLELFNPTEFDNNLMILRAIDTWAKYSYQSNCFNPFRALELNEKNSNIPPKKKLALDPHAWVPSLDEMDPKSQHFLPTSSVILATKNVAHPAYVPFNSDDDQRMFRFQFYAEDGLPHPVQCFYKITMKFAVMQSIDSGEEN